MRLFSDCFYHFLKLRSVVLDSGGMGETPCISWMWSKLVTLSQKRVSLEIMMGSKHELGNKGRYQVSQEMMILASI